jgi:plasmid replication initiation protein
MTYLDPKGEGDNSMSATSDRAQLSETVHGEARAIWRRLDCLKPNLQQMQVLIRRKDN